MTNVPLALMIVIRLYDVGTTLPPHELRTARVVAEHTLTRSGIASEWLVCPRQREAHAGNPTGCSSLVGEGELMVRVLDRPDRESSGALGYADLDTLSGSGALATVFADRVSVLADAAGVDRGTLLGWAIAHEIGHLLIGATSHAAHGLMRARWTAEEIRRGLPGDWSFLAEDAALIQKRSVRLQPDHHGSALKLDTTSSDKTDRSGDRQASSSRR